MSAPQTLPSRLIGALFVERGLVSESQIRVALEIQRETGQQLGQILVERFGVSRKELASVVAEQWAKLGGSSGPEDSASWRRLGEIFVERGFVGQEELDQALARQRQTGERLGEALVAQGVISKFELAGALAEQMAVLGDAAAETTAPREQAEATVHQLPTRDDAEDAAPATNVVELASTKGDVAAASSAPETPTEADEPPVEAVEEPVVAEAPVEAVEEVETQVEEVEAPVDTVEAPLEEVGEPQPAEVLLTDLHDALAAEVMYAGEPVSEGAPVTACLAFAPTTEGYRLVALDALPEPGETIDVPEVGERLVLRIGRSPIPADGRLCAYVEEPVTAPVMLALH